MVLVDTSAIPKTHEGLKNWVIEKSKTENYLKQTDVAMDVYSIIGGGPVPKHIKPIWPFFPLLLLTLFQKNLKKFTA